MSCLHPRFIFCLHTPCTRCSDFCRGEGRRDFYLAGGRIDYCYEFCPSFVDYSLLLFGLYSPDWMNVFSRLYIFLMTCMLVYQQNEISKFMVDSVALLSMFCCSDGPLSVKHSPIGLTYPAISICIIVIQMTAWDPE